MIKKIILFCIAYSGLPFLLRHILQRNRITILTYHDISPDLARTHFSWLQKKYNIISLRQFLAVIYGEKGSGSLPQRALVVTIDDGFKRNLELLDIVKDLNIRPTIFLCSKIIDTHRHFWWTHVTDSNTRQKLKQVSNDERIMALENYEFRHNREYPKRQALTIDEIFTMAKGIDFQSHTRTHPILPTCNDNQSLEEISVSRNELKEKLNFKISAIAYPNGSYGPRETAFVKESGYRAALTLDLGFNRIDADPYTLKRFCIPDDASVFELTTRSSGLWDGLKRFLKFEFIQSSR